MKRSRSHAVHPPRLVVALTLAVCAAGSFFVTAPVGAAHPHYERLYERGVYAFDRGEVEEAERLLRYACFGLLEEPAELAVCLTRLGLAQAAVGDDSAFRDTFGRLAEIEERFGAYTGSAISAETRAAYQREVAARVPEALRQETPAFATASEGVTPGVAESPDTAAPVRPLDAGESEPAGGAGTTPGELSPEDQRRLERAQQLFVVARDRGQLAEPLSLAAEVADARPEVFEAQNLAALIAYRAARWQDAVRYFRRAEVLGDRAGAPPEDLFYFAVSLYESGETDEAAEILRRGLPGIERTPFVRQYEAKILRTPGSPGSTGADLTQP